MKAPTVLAAKRPGRGLLLLRRLASEIRGAGGVSKSRVGQGRVRVGRVGCRVG